MGSMATLICRAKPSMRRVLRPVSLWDKRSTLRNHASRRAASTSSTAGAGTRLGGGLKVFFLGGAATASLLAIYVTVTDTRAGFHRYVVPPVIRSLFPDAEDAHHFGTLALELLYALNLHPRERASEDGSPGALSLSVFGTTLDNPVGVSAGLDKDAKIADALFATGAGVVEVGGITPRPQEGNPRPRVFRVPGVDGMVNRYGLNSQGADKVGARLRTRLRKFALGLGLTERDMLDGRGPEGVPVGGLSPGRMLLVQIAKNKETNEKDVHAVIRDYVYCVQRLAPYADVVVVNVSSPNTPGLRDLQATGPLTKILSAVVDETRRAHRKVKPKVMVKVSPDEDDDAQIEGVVQAVMTSGVDGVIVGNTTKRRSGVVPPGMRLTAEERDNLMEEGGFSGPTMFGRTLDLVTRYRTKLDTYSYGAKGRGKSTADAEPKILFASGGITNGAQALKVLNAGASVAMVYTTMVYNGSGTITRIKGEMRKELTPATSA